MDFQFVAKSVVSYIEDDVCVVSFADSLSDEPENYLILSQALFDTGDDDDDISVEFGKDGSSANGGVKSAHLSSTLFEMQVDPGLFGVSWIRITFDGPIVDDLRSHLQKIFDKSPGIFTSSS